MVTWKRRRLINRALSQGASLDSIANQRRVAPGRAGIGVTCALPDSGRQSAQDLMRRSMRELLMGIWRNRRDPVRKLGLLLAS